MRTYGGYSAVARHLSQAEGIPVSRQQVYSWARSRHVNGFPLPWKRSRGTTWVSSGKVKEGTYCLEDVAAWHKTYVPAPGRPRGKA